LGRGGAPHARRLPGASLSRGVDAVVVTHGPDPELERCLDALRPQVDQLVVVANPPAPDADATLIVNDKDLGFAANANKGIAATSAPYVVLANPDTEPRNDAVELLVEFADTRPQAGVIGPQLRFPDGRWQPSRRRFPTVRGTLVRRTPLRTILRPETRQVDHYRLEDRPTAPAQADWMLGAFLLLRREMLDELGGFDEGYRLYGEDIDLCYRAAKAGWERWYVPQAVVSHMYGAVTDRRFLTRRTLWHWRGILRFVRKHPERLKAL
jgi:GT2 family glycosyltransferase